MNINTITACAISFLTTSIHITTAHAASYTITDLGILEGGGYSYAYDINNQGQITGYSTTTGNLNPHAFQYANGNMIDLDTDSYKSIGYAINDSGYVTGHSDNTGVIYNDSNNLDIGSLYGGVTQGNDINNSGYVTGFSFTEDRYPNGLQGRHAFLYDGSSMQDLGTLGGLSSTGTGINSSGQVVGQSTNADDTETRAFLYSGGTMLDIGSFVDGYASASSINDNGQIVGSSEIAGGWNHAFLYEDGTMTDLGSLGVRNSSAYDINNYGVIVGNSQKGDDRQPSAFIYENGTMLDLCVVANCTANGWEYLTTASAINDNGDIVGWGKTFDGTATSAFLISAVPVPSAIWLFGSGLIGLIGFARRKKV